MAEAVVRGIELREVRRAPAERIDVAATRCPRARYAWMRRSTRACFSAVAAMERDGRCRRAEHLGPRRMDRARIVREALADSSTARRSRRSPRDRRFVQSESELERPSCWAPCTRGTRDYPTLIGTSMRVLMRSARRILRGVQPARRFAMRESCAPASPIEAKRQMSFAGSSRVTRHAAGSRPPGAPASARRSAGSARRRRSAANGWAPPWPGRFAFGVTPTKKNKPGTTRWKNEKSSEPVTLGTSISCPRRRRARASAASPR